MRILVTNDDGIFSEGIKVLAEALEGLGRITVVAPDRERSAAGRILGSKPYDESVHETIRRFPWPVSPGENSIVIGMWRVRRGLNGKERLFRHHCHGKDSSGSS